MFRFAFHWITFPGGTEGCIAAATRDKLGLRKGTRDRCRGRRKRGEERGKRYPRGRGSIPRRWAEVACESGIRDTQGRSSWLRSSKAKVDRFWSVAPPRTLDPLALRLLVSFVKILYTDSTILRPRISFPLRIKPLPSHENLESVARRRCKVFPGKKCYCCRWPTYEDGPFRVRLQFPQR